MPYIRPMPLTYTVLSKDNVYELMRLTGQTETELRTELEECIKFFSVRVFWQERNRWWSIRVDEEYLHLGMLDDVIYEAMRRAPYQ